MIDRSICFDVFVGKYVTRKPQDILDYLVATLITNDNPFVIYAKILK